MIIDAHIDTLTETNLNNDNICKRNENYHVDIPRLFENNVKIQVFTTYTPPEISHLNALHYALKNISKFKKNIFKSDFDMKIIRNNQDISETLKKDNCLGALLSLENGSPIMGDMDMLYTLFDVGVRMIGLTWNNRNEIADGLYVSENPSGLTRFGKAAVKKMQKMGIIVDISHIEERGFWDVIKIAEKPVVASHSNAKSLTDVPRNLTDDQLKALAETNGITGICFAPQFLDKKNKATISSVIEHMKYIADLIGVDHIGLGSDFDGIKKVPIGLENVSKYKDLIYLMKKAGFTEDEIEKITHKNWLRVFRDCLK